MSGDPFVCLSDTQQAVASTVSQSVQLTRSSPGPAGERYTVRVRNRATVEAFVKFGVVSTVTVTTATGIPVAANSIEVFGLEYVNTSNGGATIWAAVVAEQAAGLATYFTLGAGE